MLGKNALPLRYTPYPFHSEATVHFSLISVYLELTCVIFSFSSGPKLHHHSSDRRWCSIYSPSEPHAADDGGCFTCPTYPGDPASSHQYTGNPASPHWDIRDPASTDWHPRNPLSSPNQHPGASASTAGESAATA